MQSGTFCTFGNFDLRGGRSWVIRTGLKEHGWDEVICNTDVKGVLPKYRDLTKQWEAIDQKVDVLYVPFLGHYLLPLAWRIARKHKIPLVFDTFVSLYETEVHDRKCLSRVHPKAWVLWFTDWLCSRLCDVALIDTDEHIAFFQKKFGNGKKMIALPVGCRSDLFVRSDEETHNDVFTIEFHGTFIPLQGIETILRAAKILEEKGETVQFRIIGKGQTYAKMTALADELGLSSVQSEGYKPMEEIPAEIQKADVCLGIFGKTAKADRVIPNKAYEILSVGKPLITGKTAAAQRILSDRENVVLSDPGDPEDLANKILELKNNVELRNAITRGGYELFQRQFLPKTVVQPLVQLLVQLIENH